MSSRSVFLSNEEERALIAQWQKDRSSAAMQRLLNGQIAFIKKLAYKYKGFGIPFEDLVQEGRMGLIHAVTKFDLDQPVRLITYARFWIEQTIRVFVLKNWSVVSQSPSSSAWKKFSKRYALGNDASLNAPPLDGSGELQDVLVDLSMPVADQVERKIDQEWLDKLMSHLRPRDGLILKARFADPPRTLADIGSEFGISRERVRQIEVRSLAKLQKLAQQLIEA